jgi:hypothetical protein
MWLGQNGIGSLLKRLRARTAAHAPPRCPPLADVIRMRQAEENVHALRAEAKNGSEDISGPAPKTSKGRHCLA